MRFPRSSRIHPGVGSGGIARGHRRLFAAAVAPPLPTHRWTMLGDRPMVVAKALLTGTLSMVEDRLQCRVVWLVPLLAGMCVLDWFSQRQTAKALHGSQEQRNQPPQAERLRSHESRQRRKTWLDAPQNAEAAIPTWPQKQRHSEGGHPAELLDRFSGSLGSLAGFTRSRSSLEGLK